MTAQIADNDVARQPKWMQPRTAFFRLCLLTWLLCSFAVSPSALASESLSEQQRWYQDARSALARGNQDQFYALRRKLEHYPLTPYLDYHYRRGQLSQLSAQQAVEVLQRLSDTPLYQRFKHHYLTDRGRRQDWPGFLVISPESPNSEHLRCYYYRARLAQGETEEAWEGAETLWLHGKSRDDACDPLFDAWHKSGQRSDALVFQRMLLAYKAGQSGLLNYLNSLLGPSYRGAGDLLLRLYRHPRELHSARARLLRAGEPGSAIAAVVIRRQARRDIEIAWRQWQRWEAHLGDHRETVGQDLLFQALLDNQWSSDKENLLLTLPTDDLVILRVRRAIFEGDWAHLQTYLALLSDSRQNESEWRFWKGYSAMQLGQENTAQQIYAKLAKRRNFYGFLAAQHLNAPYALQATLPTSDAATRDAVQALPATARLTELMALDKWSDARAEIRWLMPRLERSEQAALLAHCHQQQWHFLTVEGTIAAQMWDALPWRFPNAHQELFEHFAKLRGLDPALLQAVARRESALYPAAHSHANAHGLMQLLPSTAKSTARRIGAPYRDFRDLYQPKRNIQLGSAYYQQLSRDYDGNRLLASAAYNAGPHRVKRWLQRADGQLDAPRFVATIPYRETREYVQAILSYQLIYAHLNQRSLPLMTESEHERRY
ncbi:transglycosylase SLT domain-containing protein [Ferrimonas gelatinilytica]|uniref:Transglycosylase SLT domain-containing protein n=1 Tax=Ferrimonas gelatinilytica TaxID=1255257 RepID=A0ABP9RUP4_9GAMM